MKKKLLLALMALLPLVGWAQTDLSTVAVDVTLNRTQLDYTGNPTAPVITAISIDGVAKTLEDGLDIQYYKKTAPNTYTEIDAAQIRNAGDYALALKDDGSGDYENVSAKVDFTINKGELHLTLTNATKVYGDPDPTIVEYTWDDISELRGSDDVNNVVITLAFSTTSRAAGEDVNTTTGYAYNEITASTPNYDITVSGSPVLFITRRPLTGTYTGTVSKVFGEDDPAFDITKLTFAGWAPSEDTDAKKAAALTIASDAKLAYTGTDANCDPDGTLLTGKSLYPITITGVTSTNYELTLPEDLGMSIKQKSIVKADGTPAEGVTITAQSATAIYNAAKQLVPASNYSVMYKGAAATFAINYWDDVDRSVAVEENNVKDVDTYYWQITGNGNFAGVYTGVTASNANGLVWEITQKDLWIYAVDDTKVYDGTAWAAEDVVFEYSGLEGDDEVTTGAGATIASNSKNVNTDGYTVTPTTGVVVIKNGANTVTSNYNIQGLATGLLKITKRPMKLTAGNKTLDLGYTAADLAAALTVDANVTVEATSTASPNRGAVAADVDDIKAAIACGLDAALATANSWDYANAGSYPEAINITWEAEVPAILKNYDITVERGDFGVNGGEFTMIAKNVTVKYGETIPAFEYLTSGNVTLKEGANVTYKIFEGTQEISAPTKVGTYTIKIDQKTSEYLPANYTGINYAPGTLTIEKKPLTVVVADQTLRKGATAPYQDAKYATITGLVGEEKVKFSIVGTAAFDTGVAPAGPIANAITVELVDPLATETGFSNGNYELGTITKGKLTVIAGLDLTCEDTDLDKINAFAGQENVPVTIDFNARNARSLGGTARTWKAEEWVVLTLPFDISVADLSAALGYAVVNVIDPSRTEINGTSSKFYGKLTMKGGNGNAAKLAANKPFLVKIVDDIANVNAPATPGIIDFGEQTIVAPADLSVEAGKGAKFTGTYTTKNVSKTDKAEIWFMLSGFQNWAYVGTNASASWDIVSTEGFIDMTKASNASEVREMTFFFEEEDGTVTAIKSVNAEGAEDAESAEGAAEGWYTINGIKLNAKPTQKGIYIFNGKKVAIQ